MKRPKHLRSEALAEVRVCVAYDLRKTRAVEACSIKRWDVNYASLAIGRQDNIGLFAKVLGKAGGYSLLLSKPESSTDRPRRPGLAEYL